MLEFLMPAEVRRSFTMPLGLSFREPKSDSIKLDVGWQNAPRRKPSDGKIRL
jgi:hypothetical protein